MHFATVPIVMALLASTDTPNPYAEKGLQEARNASVIAEVDCVHKNARDLDDGISSADVIAHAVVIACKAELDRAADTIVYGTAPHQFDNKLKESDNKMLEDLWVEMRQRTENADIGRATVIILKHRATKARSKRVGRISIPALL